MQPAGPLKILTVCGVGMGSSLMLRMYVEDVLAEIKLKARVEATARSKEVVDVGGP